MRDGLVRTRRVDLAVFVVRERRHGRSIEKLRKLLTEPEAISEIRSLSCSR